MDFDTIIALVKKERDRQDAKWGAIPRDLNHYIWLAVLTEEVGEVCKALLEGEMEHALEELIQCTAVCVAWIEDKTYKE